MATTKYYNDYLYTADNAETYPLRADQFTAGAQTTAALPVSAVNVATQTEHAKISLGRRMFGLKPRYLRLKRQGGVTPDIKKYYTNLAVLSPADFGTFSVGDAIALDGTNWNVFTKVPEQSR